MGAVIGVDLGGTNVRALAMDKQGQHLGHRIEIPSRAQEGTEAIVESLAQAIMAAAQSANQPIEKVGMAIPGFVDDESGMIYWAPNFGHYEGTLFHYWQDVPLRKLLEKHLEFPLVMGNDANLAALGEYRFGSGNNAAKSLVMITLGTGVGGGVVIDPSSVQGNLSSPVVLLGGNRGGAEFGHISLNPSGVECTAGSYGCLEAYCQRDSIIRRAQYKLKRGRKSYINELVQGDLSKVEPLHITQACDQSDEVALEVYREIGTFLGQGLGTLINIFAPEVVAVGGQIAKAGAYILDPARISAKNVAIPNLYDFARIVNAQEIDDAGLLGAAALALI